MKSTLPTIRHLLAVASELTGSSAVLVDDLSLSGRAVVLRVALDHGETAIAKRPESPAAYARELTALQLLPPVTRPALIGAAEGVLVIEDLGQGPSLADLLLGTDGTAAEGALRTWARTLGMALRGTLRAGAPTEVLNVERGLEELAGLAADMDVAVPAGLDVEVRSIEDALSAESPWLAYCPGDTCPDNNRLLADGSVRLFDFEGSGWRHAATEAAYCVAPFCTCWCLAALPAGMTASLEAEFLDVLDPPQRDEFRSLVGLAAVSWTLVTFGYFRRFALHGGPVGPPDRALIDGRQYVLLRLAAVDSQRARIPVLAGLARRLSEAIVRRWPQTGEVPTYPAFRP